MGKEMRQLFFEIDADGDSEITWTEFEAALNRQDIADYMNAIGLDSSDARTLFKMLDWDNTGNIDIEEFLFGCRQLTGAAKALDIAKLQHQNQYLTRNIQAMRTTVNRNTEQLQRNGNLRKGISEVSGSTNGPDGWTSACGGLEDKH